MSKLPINLATVLKRIDIIDMNFAEKRNLIQSLVEKIVYSQEQLVIYTGNIIAKNCGKSAKKEHPAELSRDV